MAFLIFNVGSETIKWAVYSNKWVSEGKKEVDGSFAGAMRILLDEISRKYDITLIVHRVVHGGNFKKSVIINKGVLEEIKKFSGIAPLHQKNEIEAIGICSEKFRGLKQVAVFDTAFYRLPKKAEIYAIPYSFYKRGIKRYGFHGISHQYVADRIKGVSKKYNRIISCHLGAGCSVTAIKNNELVETSMGFTPLEGVVMTTRSGSIDPGLLLYLQKKTKDLKKMLNQESGMFGISGIKDIRKTLESSAPNSKLAIELFCYSVAKQIGAYIPVLGGIEAIAFTGGIGENSHVIRKKILDYFDFMKIDLNSKKNINNDFLISSPRSRIGVFVVKANEKEIMLKEGNKLKWVKK